MPSIHSFPVIKSMRSFLRRHLEDVEQLKLTILDLSGWEASNYNNWAAYTSY